MHYQTSHNIYQFDFLEITPRKKQLKHQLIHLTHGNLLMRLGKYEYFINAPHLIWLPAQCLVSLTFLPKTQITKVEISTRIKQVLPKAAGSIAITNSIDDTFLSVCLDKLSTITFSTDNKPLNLLYQILLNEIKSQQPSLNTLQDIDKININDDHFELLALSLQVREAIKLSQSGCNKEKILDLLFSNNIDNANCVFEKIAGHTFYNLFK